MHFRDIIHAGIGLAYLLGVMEISAAGATYRGLQNGLSREQIECGIMLEAPRAIEYVTRPSRNAVYEIFDR